MLQSNNQLFIYLLSIDMLSMSSGALQLKAYQDRHRMLWNQGHRRRWASQPYNSTNTTNETVHMTA
jgi:hypothetical protein